MFNLLICLYNITLNNDINLNILELFLSQIEDDFFNRNN